MRKYLLAPLLLGAAPGQAGLNFGLGKAAAKKSAQILEKAVNKSTEPVPGAEQPSSSGRLRWSYIGEPVYYASPAIAADGTVYFATSHHYVYYNGYWSQGQKPPLKPYGVYAYTPDGLMKWKYADGMDAPARGSPAIAGDGTLYLGKTYGAFMAVRTGSLGLSADAQWPKYRFSNLNTGRTP